MFWIQLYSLSPLPDWTVQIFAVPVSFAFLWSPMRSHLLPARVKCTVDNSCDKLYIFLVSQMYGKSRCGNLRSACIVDHSLLTKSPKPLGHVKKALSNAILTRSQWKNSTRYRLAAMFILIISRCWLYSVLYEIWRYFVVLWRGKNI